MTDYSIFIVDDEEVAREGVSLALNREYRVRSFESAEAAIDALEERVPDLVLMDIGLPGMSGVEALQAMKSRYPDIVVIMITAFEDVDTVIKAMRLGAFDYMVKPLKMETLLGNIKNALETIAMRKEIQGLHEKVLKENLPCFIGESNVVQDVMEVVKKVAASPDTPVLIVGETGTGKELIAKAIHYRSPLFKGPLVSMNCAAIPKELVESELFGYEKGAFSGADARGKQGLVEQAADGTLFMDEVGDLSMSAQAKLLRFLEDGEYYRVGGTRKRSVRPRVVSATNRGLPGMISDGNFREDLYFRLAVVKIEVPSLNERREDILLIAKHFLLEFNKKFGKSFNRISLPAETALKSHEWTGNVRELKNIMERAVLMGEGVELTPEHLNLRGRPPAAPATATASGEGAMPRLTADGVDFSALMASIERRYFTDALEMAGGNESRAAKLLGLSRDKFRYRRKKCLDDR
ncbi:MAG: sigma-54 dependent transcriptional regulator [Deltaproteobacteria bacterium]|nr:sigma-54 dependent transcriptional regulator [Deltaproteobacteria bacterium]